MTPEEWAKAVAPTNPCRPEVLADVDEVAVARACRGERPSHLTRSEMAEAFLRLDRIGLSATQIGELLGVSARTVCRWRSGLHFPSSVPRSPDHGGLRRAAT